jgi:hypothetical protein
MPLLRIFCESLVSFFRECLFSLDKDVQMNYHLAQINIGRIKAPLDSPVMAEFVENLDPINLLAEKSDGFIWRLKDESNNASSIRVYDDDFMIVNLSVWKDIESLFKFVYQSNHTEIFKKRRGWFEQLKEMHMALWYVSAGQVPTVAEAVERLDFLRRNGETPHSFTFKSKFTMDDAVRFKATEI